MLLFVVLDDSVFFLDLIANPRKMKLYLYFHDRRKRGTLETAIVNRFIQEMQNMYTGDIVNQEMK